MIALARGQTNSCSLPVLVLHTIFDGILKDAYSAEFTIEYNGSQVYPGSGRQAITLTACPTGHRIRLGTYVAPWAVPSNASIGRHTATWYYKEAATSDEVTWSQTFEVVRQIFDPRAPLYAFVDDLRCDVCDVKRTSDDRKLSELLAMASRYVERYTGRFFEAKSQNVYRDGRASPALRLQDPIIAIGEVAIDFGPLVTGELEIDMEDLLVYNRHLTQGLNQPDDRNAPKIELFRVPEEARVFSTETRFPEGRQNIRVLGVFGFTDPNGTPIGETPYLIQHATKLLALRNLYGLLATQKRDRAMRNWRLVSESGQQSSYKLAELEDTNPVFSGRFSGDPEIDQILASYCRPPMIGVV